MKEKDFQTPLSAPRTPSNFPKKPSDILRHSHITPDISKTLPNECFGVFKGVLGCWVVYKWLRGLSGSLFPSFANNFRKSQVLFLTFFSKPGGSRCVNYQNVISYGRFDLLGSLGRGLGAEL